MLIGSAVCIADSAMPGATLSLLCACQLAAVIFRGPEYHARADRLASLAKMDLVGREVSRAIDALGKALLGASPLRL